MKLLLAIAATAALMSGVAVAADLGPAPQQPQKHVQRYAPVPDEAPAPNYPPPQQYAAPQLPAPTCPNQFAGVAPTCAGAAYGTPCGAGYGLPYYPGVMTAYGYPYGGYYGRGYGGRGFGIGARVGLRRF
jgi:hypothetical protein